MTPEESLKEGLKGNTKELYLTAILVLEALTCRTGKQKYQKYAWKLVEEMKNDT